MSSTERPNPEEARPAAQPAAPPGVYVLGMHRSGTSVAAGLLDRLGLDGGPRASMLAPDQFNSDGYWEQRPIVEWHDEVLSRLRGWASAPPHPPDAEQISRLCTELGPSANAMLCGLYRSTWFMKDPRQCLLLGLWSRLRGTSELAVVVNRNPVEVIRSLQRRNAYAHGLAAGLWEQYNRELILGLEGRPCIFISYEELTANPEPNVASLADALDRHVGTTTPFRDKVGDAVGLVRPQREPLPDGGSRLSREQGLLYELFLELTGYHEKFEVPDRIPPPTQDTLKVIERRRNRLNRLRPILRSSSDMQAALDRVPALFRRLRVRRTDRG